MKLELGLGLGGKERGLGIREGRERRTRQMAQRILAALAPSLLALPAAPPPPWFF